MEVSCEVRAMGHLVTLLTGPRPSTLVSWLNVNRDKVIDDKLSELHAAFLFHCYGHNLGPECNKQSPSAECIPDPIPDLQLIFYRILFCFEKSSHHTAQYVAQTGFTFS